MSDSSPLPLQRLLAEEAERAVPTDLDLWPDVAQRLRERGVTFDAGTTTQDLGKDHATHRHGEARSAHHASGWRRPGEWFGSAISFGLGALAIVIIALIVGLPGRDGDAPGIGAGTPALVAPSGPTPSGTPSPGTTVDCTFNLDVSPETEGDRVVIPVLASAKGNCGNAHTLSLTIVTATGEPAPIAGSPQTVPLTVSGEESRAEVTVDWSNWCGTPGRFRIETQVGNERHTLPLPDPPRCTDQQRPSAMRLSIAGAAAATPATPMPAGTPVSS